MYNYLTLYCVQSMRQSDKTLNSDKICFTYFGRNVIFSHFMLNIYY